MAATELRQLGGLTLLEFSASQLGIFGRPNGPGKFIPTSPLEVLALSGGVAALDGPMFDFCPNISLPSGSEISRYAASSCDMPQFMVYDPSRNVAAAGRRPRDGRTISIVNGQAVVLSGAQVAPGARVAVQLYPWLVTDGRNMANPAIDAGVEVRAALVILRDGRMAFAVARASMYDFASMLVRAGVLHGGYTDGGGSGVAVGPDGHLYGANEHRRVPIWFVVESGSSSAALLAFGVALAALGVYAATKVMR